jgi:hypothetical protein
MLKKKFLRDGWNVLISKLPSRTVRIFWLQKMLGEFRTGSFMCTDVHIMAPYNVEMAVKIKLKLAMMSISAHIRISGR